MKAESKFDLFQEVYLRHDVEQKSRMITQIIFAGTGVIYQLSCGTENSLHDEQEISADLNQLKKLGLVEESNP